VKTFENIVKDMDSSSRYKVVVIPTLSHEETKAFLEENGNGANFADWYDKVGGVPRNLINAETVAEAVDDQQANVHKVMFDPTDSGTDKETNKIVKMVPNSRSGGVVFDFVSANACRLWTQTFRGQGRTADLLRKLREARDQKIRDAYGRFFEGWVLSLLENQEALCWSVLPADGTARGLLTPWVLPHPLVQTKFPGDEPSSIVPSKRPTLHIPMSSEFPVVDAVITDAVPASGGPAPTVLIQVTVAQDHHPKADKAQKLIAALKENNCTITALVWVVDGKSSLNKWQSLEGGTTDAEYDAIPQYLCRVDDLMVWVRKQGSNPTPEPVGFPMSTVPHESVLLGEVKKLVDPGAKKISNFSTGRGTKSSPYIYSHIVYVREGV